MQKSTPLNANTVWASNFVEESEVSELMQSENYDENGSKVKSFEELEIRRWREEIVKLQNKNKNLRNNLSAIFNDDQLFSLEKNRNEKRTQGKRDLF